MSKLTVKMFDAPFGCIPALRLSIVPRWGIISMLREQSVAEHCYNVAVIARYLCEQNGYEKHINSVVMEVLDHDHYEAWTGDIPGPAKGNNGLEDGVSPIVKLADRVEACRYAILYCNDTESMKNYVINGLKQEIAELSRSISIDFSIITRILEGK